MFFPYRWFIVFSVTVLSSVTSEINQTFSLSNVTSTHPSRYHALGLFNNDHTSRKRIAVRKCQSNNFIYPVKILSTEQPFFCPAVFISADSLLTTALCLKMLQHKDEHPSSHMFLTIDRENVFFYESGRRYVSKVFYHTKFDDEPGYYNVAIVKLRYPVYDSDPSGRSHVSCLWPEKHFRNSKAVLSEWFEFEPEQNPSFRWLDLPIIPQEECRNELGKMEQSLPELSQGLQDFQTCVRDNRNSTVIQFCDARSSGPLQMSVGNTVYVIGLPTVHIDDCTVHVEVFNKITHYLDWIESVVWPGQE
ncbi:serine protease Hayan-like [Sabethes cyaneus]|uniref:serine protease Hayan-like n=1 Tax=Sabethes cyaneus TaxID=53552 RepID=UPI00237DEDCC|nr:serine protease Hayan-like [Sabethes cyaneus]